jgi:hypothetical protein
LIGLLGTTGAVVVVELADELDVVDMFDDELDVVEMFTVPVLTLQPARQTTRLAIVRAPTDEAIECLLSRLLSTFCPRLCPGHQSFPAPFFGDATDKSEEPQVGDPRMPGTCRRCSVRRGAKSGRCQ